MKKAFFIVFLTVLVPLLFSEETFSTVKTYEELVSNLIDLKRQLSEEKEAWKEQQAWLKQEKELQVKEKEMLEKEIADAKEEEVSAKIEKAGILEQKKVLQESLDNCLPVITRAEANLKKWHELLPIVLAKPLQKVFDELEKGKERSISKRLQVVLALFGEIERLGNGVHLIKETLVAAGGKKQEMDVIYLGLARAFAVSKDNKIAGISVPGKDGWKWDWHPEIAESVRKAIDSYNSREMAEFVHLPVKVERHKVTKAHRKGTKAHRKGTKAHRKGTKAQSDKGT